MLTKKQEQLLAKVQKPARYTGGEVNSVVKDKNHVKLRYATTMKSVCRTLE